LKKTRAIVKSILIMILVFLIVGVIYGYAYLLTKINSLVISLLAISIPSFIGGVIIFYYMFKRFEEN